MKATEEGHLKREGESTISLNIHRITCAMILIKDSYKILLLFREFQGGEADGIRGHGAEVKTLVVPSVGVGVVGGKL
jgi:hypothetical protein